MRSTNLLAGLLLTVFMVGCNALEPSFRHTIFNDEPGSLCTGGMRGVSGTGSVIGDSGLVAVGERAFASWDMPQGSPSGTPITMEAWCYGQDEAELAYLKLTRGYRDGMLGSISTFALQPNFDPETTESCIKPEVGDLQRGPLICISSDF